jgi:hypothetical protein
VSKCPQCDVVGGTTLLTFDFLVFENQVIDKGGIF